MSEDAERELSYAVVIPAYNASETLADTLSALTEQTVLPTTILVADDGSSDDTCAVASGFPGVKAITYPHSGLAGVQNRGLGDVGDDFVAFVDADDTWHPRTGEVLTTALREHGADLAGVGRVDFAHGSRPVFPESADSVTWRRVTPEELWDRNTLEKSGLMFRRSALLGAGGYREDLAAAEDLDLSLRILEAGGSVIATTWQGMGYRTWASSMSRQPARMIKAEATVVLPRVAKAYGEDSREYRRRARKIWYNAAARAANDRRSMADVPPLSSVGHRPTFFDRGVDVVLRSPARDAVGRAWRTFRAAREALRQRTRPRES